MKHQNLHHAFALAVVIVHLHAFGSPQKTLETDVLVIGGGTGGSAAGIQSARSGAKTIIVEETPWLGGMLSAAGVSATDGNYKLPSGLFEEFRQALYTHYGTRNLMMGWVSNTMFEPHVADSILKAFAAREKNLTVLYETSFSACILQNRKVVGAAFRSREGTEIKVTAKITIDGTEFGDVFADAGCGFDAGMDDPSSSGEQEAVGKNDILQDMTYVAVLKDFGSDSTRTIARPPSFDASLYGRSCTFGGDTAQIVSCKKMLDYGKLPNKKYMINWPIHGNDYPVSVADILVPARFETYRQARNRTLGFVYYIQTHLGFRNLGLADDEYPTADRLPFFPYIREGRRVRGIVRLNLGQLQKPFDQAAKLYRTAVSVGDYPLDLHLGAHTGAPHVKLPPIPSFSVPLGALIPGQVDGLIVAEKGISVTNLANGATRLQPCVLLTGQAAGILAAQCLHSNVQPRAVNIRRVQEKLLEARCFLMPYVDVQPDNPNWPAIQRVGATGILRGTGKPEGWANRTFFYPDSTITVAEFCEGLGGYVTGLDPEKEDGRDLTIRHAWSLIVNDRRETAATIPDTTIIRLFRELHLSNFEAGRTITRAELAALVDALLHPFSRPVDFNGDLVRE